MFKYLNPKRFYFAVGRKRFIEFIIFAVFILFFYGPLLNMCMLAFADTYTVPAVFPQQWGIKWWKFIFGQQSLVSSIVQSFTVAAVVSSGYQELDALWFFIPIETGFSIIPKDSAIVSVMMECADAFSPSLYGIQNECASLLNGEATVFRWDELNASQLENFSSIPSFNPFLLPYPFHCSTTYHQ